jgi:hypothetical protein
MDLFTLERKLINNSYKNFSGAYNDFRLIWENCMLFNMEDSYIYKCAKIMKKKTNELFSEYFEKGSTDLKKDVNRKRKSEKSVINKKKKIKPIKSQTKIQKNKEENLSDSLGEQ